MKEDWIECKLGEILNIERGGSPRPIKEFITNDENGINWIKISDATNSGKYILKTIQKIRPTGLKNSREVFPGDLLLSNSMSFGKPYIMGINGAIHDGWLVIRDNKFLDKNYLFYALASPITYNQFSQNAKGSTVKNLNIEIVREVTIKVNPLPIQKGIVKKIEELFSSLDSGIADLKKAQEQLVIYRQAVLSSTFLTKEKIQISELVNKLSQGWSPKCLNQNSTDNEQWAVIKTSAVQGGKFVDFENKILPDSLEPRKQHEIKVGDVLITRAGPRVRVGICCLVRKTRPRLINCDKVYRLELNKKLVNPKYFEHALNSPAILSKIERMKTGSSDSGLNLTQTIFLKLEIPFAGLEEQSRVVREIESRLSVCDKVEESIAESLGKAKALRQSILKKAFEGKLLSAEELAKCKADQDYEPASVLLEKIKKEKKKNCFG